MCFQKNAAIMYLDVTVIIIEIYDGGSRYLGTHDSCGAFTIHRWTVINQIPKTGYTVLIRYRELGKMIARRNIVARIFSRWRNILLPTKTRLKPVSPASP